MDQVAAVLELAADYEAAQNSIDASADRGGLRAARVADSVNEHHGRLALNHVGPRSAY